MSNPKAKKKLTPRQERRKEFIKSFLKQDRFVNIRTDQLRLIVDEEQELYDFLELMDTALLGKEREKPEFMDKTLTIEEDGTVFLEGKAINFAGDPTPTFEEALWILTQPNSSKKVNDTNRHPLCNNLLVLVERLCDMDRDSEADLRRHSLASTAALALFCLSPHWNEALTIEARRVGKESPFALVRSILKMGVLKVESSGTGVNVEQAFARGKAKKRFMKKKKGATVQNPDTPGEGGQEERPRRRRRRRRRR